jgi:hypothetical protein
MQPFPRKMVHEVAAGRALDDRYSNYSIRPARKRRPKPLREWLDRSVPPTAGVPRSYGLYTSSLLEVVAGGARYPVCTTPPEKPITTGHWNRHLLDELTPLLRVNVRPYALARPAAACWCGICYICS